MGHHAVCIVSDPARFLLSFAFLFLSLQTVSSQSDPCVSRNPEDFANYNPSSGITWLNIPYNFDVQPGTKSGFSVGFIKAEKSGSTLFYTIASDPQDLFLVDFTTGELTLQNDIDERQAALGTNQFCASFFAFAGSAQSQIGVGLYRAVETNLNTPNFTKSTYDETVAEDVTIGSSILTVDATDADTGEDGRLTYNITSGNSNGVFKINSTSGQITLEKTLDYESQTDYTFTVTATDNGKTPKSGSAVVNVTVSDVNDNAPEILDTPIAASVSENAAVGAKVVTINATDSDSGANAQIIFSLSGSSLFAINSSTGIITVNGALDYEKTESYSLTVTVTNPGRTDLNGSAVVTISLLNVNEHAPVIVPDVSEKVLLEGAPKGTVLVVFNVTDADSGTSGEYNVSIVASTNPNDTFAIETNNRLVVNAAQLDYQPSKSTFALTIVASDGGKPSKLSNVTVTIDVRPKNRNDPVFVNGSSVAVSVKENAPIGTSVFFARATDSDFGVGGELTYSLSGDATERFAINTATGLVTVNGALDREMKEKYVLVVVASDGGAFESGSVRSSNFTIEIVLTDVNEFGPQFTKTFFSLQVNQDTPKDTVLQSFNVSDADAGDNAAFDITIDPSSNPHGEFAINGNGDLIVNATQIDYDPLRSIFNLTLVATDRGDVPLSSTAVVQIEVRSLNKYSPVFVNGPLVNAEVKENSPIGTSVIRLTATDEDKGSAGTITYSISSDGSGGKFSIDSSTGELTVNGSLDRETESVFVVVVIASDSGSDLSPKRSSNTTVNVTVVDENDNVPKFSPTLYDDVYISFDSVRGRSIAVFSASDDDAGLAAEITLSVISSDTGLVSNIFRIDSVTGELTLNVSRPTPGEYRLRIKATDGGTPAQSANASIIVIVVSEAFGDPYLSPAADSVSISVSTAISSSELTSNTSFEIFQLLHQSAGSGGEAQAKFEEAIRKAVTDANSVVFKNKTPDWATLRLYFSTAKLTEIRTRFACPSRSVSSCGSGLTLFYPTFDGTCNNLNNNLWGAADVSFQRLLNASYSDQSFNAPIGIDQLTTSPSTPFDSPKPSPRHVSTSLLKHVSVGSPRNLTQLASAFGRFVFNDIHRVAGSVSTNAFGSGTSCTSSSDYAEPCFPVQVRTTDPVFGTSGSSGKAKSYLEYARSRATCNDGADLLAAREQINLVSSYIDGSSIYGQNPLLLRGEKGLLKVNAVSSSSGKDLLPDDSSTSLRCQGSLCAQTGDLRSNEHIGLTALHTIFLREHNRISRQLAILNPTWTDTSLFYETREIVRGMIQHITFEEFLPALFGGKRELNTYVGSLSSGVDATTVNGFATAVSRLLLSQLTSEVKRLDANFNSAASLDFSSSFFNPLEIRSNLDAILRGLATNSAKAIDENIISQATAEYYKTSTDYGTDLAAIAIQQGRDHGLSDYKAWKDYCVTKFGSTGSFSSGVAALLTSLYGDFDKADLFAGGISEDSDGLGPVFKCILSLQFKQVRDGDRFWYTRSGVFTSEQLTEIHKVTLSQLVSRNGDDIKTYPVDAFNVFSSKSSFAGQNLDLGKWDLSVYCPPSEPSKPAVLNGTNKNASLLESEKPGAFVISVAKPAPLPTVNRITTYSISSGNTGDTFRIDSATGDIYTVISLDRETVSSFTLQIEASDEAFGNCTGPVTRFSVVVTILDVNDNAPEFAAFSHVVNAEQTLPIGRLLTAVSCTDGDTGSVQYSFLSGNEDGVFSIDAVSGNVTLSKSLDPSKRDLYDLTLLCSDGKFNDTAQLTVSVVEVNLNAPVFTNEPYLVVLAENASVGTTVTTLSAEDPDLGSVGDIRYSIESGNDDNLFHVDPISGVIELTKDLDYETRQSFSLFVKAADRASVPKSDTTYVNVTVTDVNDNAPHFGQSLYYVTILESAAIGTSLADLNATDIDTGKNAEIDYFLINGNSDGAFRIDGLGRLFLNKLLQADTVPSYLLTVEASDRGRPQLSSTAAVNVRVTAINDAKPIFEKPTYVVDVNEDAAFGLSLVQVSASDGDGDANLRYSIVTLSVSTLFRIDSLTGVITLIGSLDYEGVNEYVFVVQVTDGLFVSATNVSVNVANVNDIDPAFSEASYRLSLSESYPLGQVGLTVTCTDGDGDSVSYGIRSGDSFALPFGIYRNGTVYLATPLDASADGEHVVVLTCADSGVPPRNTTVFLFVSVLSDNLETPQFLQASYSGSVAENAVLGFIVLTVSASDNDAGPAGRVTYSIVGGDGSSVFVVDRTAGAIVTISSLDVEVKASYLLVVEAKDEGIPARSSSVNVSLTVTNVHDEEPEFERRVYVASVKEDISAAVVIANVSCKDTESSDPVSYSVKNSSLFTITADGMVYLTSSSSLDYETSTKHDVTIECRDSGNHTAETLLTINVLGVNEYAPQLFTTGLFRTVDETTPIGTVISQISASDEDTGKDGEVTYEALDGTKGLVRLDRVTGELILVATIELANLPNSFLNIQVVARDGGLSTEIVEIEISHYHFP